MAMELVTLVTTVCLSVTVTRKTMTGMNLEMNVTWMMIMMVKF
jgi:hypothetical protein